MQKGVRAKNSGLPPTQRQWQAAVKVYDGGTVFAPFLRVPTKHDAPDGGASATVALHLFSINNPIDRIPYILAAVATQAHTPDDTANSHEGVVTAVGIHRPKHIIML